MDVRGVFFLYGNAVPSPASFPTMTWPWLHRIVALVLAANYFAFQVELFEEEYEANHPQAYGAPSVTQPTLTWESFDKDNAPQAFVCDANIRIELLFVLCVPAFRPPLAFPQYQPVRDKSPPRDQRPAV